MYTQGGRGRGFGGRGFGGGRAFQGDARFRGRGNRVHDDGGDGSGGGKGGGKGRRAAAALQGAGGKGGRGKGGGGPGGRGSSLAMAYQPPLAERNAEIDRIDGVFGYDKIDKLETGVERRWLTNMRQVLLEDAEDGSQFSAVEYYFLAPDGTGFKCALPSAAYCYLYVAAGHEADVDTSLRRKFPEQILDILSVEIEDLTLPNHLSGKKKRCLKLLFANTRKLMDVRRLLLPRCRRIGRRRTRRLRTRRSTLAAARAAARTAGW